MDRTIYVERLYSLGQFKNIKFSSALTGIPEELARNDKLAALFMFQSAIACEIAYRQYYEMVARISEQEIKNVLDYLEEQRSKTYNDLYSEIREHVEGQKKSLTGAAKNEQEDTELVDEGDK